jgi:hypothetical protein
MNAKRIVAAAIYYPPIIVGIILVGVPLLLVAPIALPVMGLEKLWDWAKQEVQ